MDIKIAICFMIICFIPFAGSAQGDTVWTAISSGFIRSNEFLSYDNYLVKAAILDNETASISVYKDSSLIEKKDFKVSEFKKYGDIGLTLSGIQDGNSWISISKQEKRDIWMLSGKTQLKWGESYVIENHTFSIDTMTSDSVSLTITNKTLTRTVAFKKGIPGYLDNLRTMVTDINRTGIIELEFYSYSIPTLKAEITTDKDEYFPDENVSVLINITVDGLFDIVGITLESNPPSTIKPGMLSAANVSGTSTFPSYLSEIHENSSITISAHIEAMDFLKNRYSTDINRVINTTPVISISKIVPEDTDEENVTIMLNIHNAGKDIEIVSVYDTIPHDMTTRQLDWRIEIQPRNSTHIFYKVSPGKPGEYVFPPAIAKWKIYSTSSNKTTMTAHRPYIIIKKSASRNNNLTDVDIIIENTGDRPAHVNLTDEIPDGHYIGRGSSDWSGFVDGGKSESMNYSLKGDIRSLPPASAIYRDLQGAIRKAQSNNVTTITAAANYTSKAVKEVKEKTPANAGQYEIISFMILSFMLLSIIIGSVALGAYLATRIKTRVK